MQPVEQLGEAVDIALRINERVVRLGRKEALEGPKTVELRRDVERGGAIRGVLRVAISEPIQHFGTGKAAKLDDTNPFPHALRLQAGST